MGWGHGIASDGREIGYLVEATCEHPGCTTKIDRGLAYACGGLAAVLGEPDAAGCGHHFCPEHLFMGVGHSQGCEACCAKWDAEHPQWFLLVCLECTPPLTMPFDGPESRGDWAVAHRDGTGHDRWRFWEVERASV